MNRIASALAAALTLGALAGCREQPEPPPKDFPLVETVRVETRAFDRDFRAAGEIAPAFEAVSAARTGGLPIMELLAETGDRVSKGQVLALLDSAAAKADLDAAAAALEDASAADHEAAANAKRLARLEAPGALSEKERDAISVAARRSAAQVAAAKARLDAAKAAYDKTFVRALDDGVVVSRSALLGAAPSSGTELFRVAGRGGAVEWRAEIPEAAGPLIGVGSECAVEGAGGRRTKGAIRHIEPSADPSKKTALARCLLDEPRGQRFGRLASGLLKGGSGDYPAIPESAVAWKDGKSFAFVFASADSTVRLRPIQTAAAFDGKVPVVEGLSAGDEVVASGTAFLRDGQRVRPSQKPVAALAPKAAPPSVPAPSPSGAKAKPPSKTPRPTPPPEPTPEPSVAPALQAPASLVPSAQASHEAPAAEPSNVAIPAEPR